MPRPSDVYVRCDELERLPARCRENWLYEIELLRQELPKGARIVQVGSMDGTRAIRLLEARPDLSVTGLEIDEALVALAQEKAAAAGIRAQFVHGDITSPPALRFDYCVCLNNTLGYISDQEKAVAGMKTLGERVIISVYGEKFNDLARAYFTAVGLELARIEPGRFVMKDFTSVRRYRRGDVASWGTVIETPIGYYCVLGKEKRS